MRSAVALAVLLSTVAVTAAFGQGRTSGSNQRAQGTPAASAPAQAPPPVPSDPQRTTASFGDWTLRCERLGDGPRVCEVASSVVANAQGQSSPIAQVAIGRTVRTEPLRLTVVLPLSVSFAATPKVLPDEKGKPLLDLAWRRCLPTGCFADAAADEGALAALKARSEPARITFRDAAEREIALPFSSRGLAQALDALAKEGV